MPSKNNLPSVDLMSCQHGGEVIPSIAIERIISLRDEGIRVYLDGIDKLRKARDLMQQAGGCQYLYDYDKAVLTSTNRLIRPILTKAIFTAPGADRLLRPARGV
ncbi:TPA: hypothetical protein ACQ2HL_004866 [Klebsiella pneumoniae]